jgi:tRNA(Ser,Leu) C12 N-acetylase TAN1
MKPGICRIADRGKLPLIAMMILSLHITGILSLTAQQKPARQSSVEAFSKGDYELAYSGFSELLITFPKDPLYKYYSGVCLVKMNRDPESALMLLEQAQQGSAVVRTVPSDASFWLGRAQQMNGLFAEAVTSYNKFTEQNGKKASRDLEIPVFLQQCNDRKGQISEPSPEPAAEVVSDMKTEKPSVESSGVKIRAEQTVEQPEESIPVNFDLILSEALEFQFKADSLYKIAEELNSNLDKLDYKGKIELRTKIAGTETLAASFQKKADMKYAEAQTSMNSTSFSIVNIAEKEIIPSADPSSLKKPEPEIEVPKSVIPVKKDTVAVRKDPVKAETTSSVVSPAGLFSVFGVSKPETGTTEKIKVNSTIPQGLIYRIQVAVFKNPVAVSYFKGITPVYGFRIAGNDYTTYFAGMFRRIGDARKALVAVKQKGFRDAFIVALSGGKPVSIERAMVLEKEWGKKPLMEEQQTYSIPADTIPPELCFRVEVMRSVKPVKPDVLESMKNVAGTKGLDTEIDADDKTVYLVGKFITYESALDYADLLVRNGYREAKVVARLGKKEVPVEIARTLFEKIE